MDLEPSFWTKTADFIPFRPENVNCSLPNFLTMNEKGTESLKRLLDDQLSGYFHIIMAVRLKFRRKLMRKYGRKGQFGPKSPEVQNLSTSINFFLRTHFYSNLMIITVEKNRSHLVRFRIGLNYACLPDYSPSF